MNLEAPAVPRQSSYAQTQHCGQLGSPQNFDLPQMVSGFLGNSNMRELLPPTLNETAASLNNEFQQVSLSIY